MSSHGEESAALEEAQVEAIPVAEDDVALEQDYKVKADELENRLDRLEGRQNKEEMLAAWFESQDSDVTVKPILKKGMGMVSRRPVENEKLILVCPPYVCVPYEPRKQFVCAYCFKEYKSLEERHKTALEAAAAAMAVVENESAETPVAEGNVEPSGIQAEALGASLSKLAVSKEESAVEGENPENEGETVEEPVEALLNCEGCHEVWYCNEECRDLDRPEHGHYECAALARFDIPWAKNYYSYCDDLVTDIRLLLRAMNKRYWQLEQGIGEFEEEYQLLISNMNCYSEDVLASLRSIVQYANYLLPEPLSVDENELLEVYCKHRVNMFGLWANGGECLGYGVYPRASYFNHSCWPNTTFYKNPELKVPHMNFLTVWPIEKEGEEVCISYIDISAGLRDRRNTLLDKYFFHCTCERCMLQELSPQEPDPYYIYWAPAPPPDGYPPDYQPPAIPEDATQFQASDQVSNQPSSNLTHTEPSPFEVVS
jgi:hypothetical protein